MLPPYLIARFWQDVERELTARYGLAARDAQRGIARYKERMAEGDAVDATYHWDPPDVASAIRTGGYLPAAARARSG